MSDLWIPPHIMAQQAKARRYTADELVELAVENHYKANTSLLREWVRLGLMGKPEEGERGRLKSPQAGLWLKLLEERERQKGNVVALCNLPVGIWIFFGDAMGGISRAQVQRAMHTWAEKQKPPSLEAGRRTVQRLTKMVKTKDAQQVRVAKKRLNDLLTRNKLDIPGLRDSLVLLMEGRKPEKRGQIKGPRGAAFSVDILLDFWETRQRAIGNIHIFEDWIWEWARMEVLFSLDQYQQDYPRLVKEARQFPELQQLFQVETISTVISGICMNFAFLMQVAFENTQATPPCPIIPGLAEPLQLHWWRDGLVWGEVTSSPVVNSIGQAVSLNVSVSFHRSTEQELMP